MRAFVVRIMIAVLLLAAGAVLRRTGAIELMLTDARERLATGPAAMTPAGYDALEGRLGIAAQVPLLGDRLREDIGDQRALAAYWNGDYASVVTAGAATTPTRQWLAANARYRRTIQAGGDRATLLRGLDEALQGYGDLLRAEAGHAGAAYNYEFVSRLRTVLARGRQAEPPSYDGPPNPNGDQGQPPEGTKPPEFNVIVPLRPDERQEQFDAGTGGVTRRRG